jgi:type II protein arginine methyltransferase
VEKNPNAIVTLTCLIKSMWPDKEIELIADDMRKVDLNEKADILVSELLGSFGDNELSPECLDGVQHFLKPTGVSIPSNSISYIRPIQSKRNYLNLTKNFPDHIRPFREQNCDILEVSWVTLLGSVYYIDEPKELFKFVHPNKDDPIDNTRYGKLEFHAEIDCLLHG